MPMGIIEERTGNGTRFREGTLGRCDVLAMRTCVDSDDLAAEAAFLAREEMLAELEETDPFAYIEALNEIEREQRSEEERRRRSERAAEMRAAARMGRRRS